jgi:HPt (histidine-containing phosphotransfer) domain-containing protein
MDRTTLLARFLDDEALLCEMVTRLLARLPPELDAMRAAAAVRDAAAMHELAHSLKGSLGLFGPSTAYDVASRFESLSRNGDVENVAREMGALEASLGPDDGATRDKITDILEWTEQVRDLLRRLQTLREYRSTPYVSDSHILDIRIN